MTIQTETMRNLHTTVLETIYNIVGSKQMLLGFQYSSAFHASYSCFFQLCDFLLHYPLLQIQSLRDCTEFTTNVIHNSRLL